jgi:hypothetical protein
MEPLDGEPRTYFLYGLDKASKLLARKPCVGQVEFQTVMTILYNDGGHLIADTQQPLPAIQW